MTRHIHHRTVMVFVTTRLPDGTTLDRRVDGIMDLGRYESSRDVLRESAEAAGGTLDSTEADEVWARRQTAKERHDAAMKAWMAAGAPAGGHPGGHEDWME